MSLHHIEKLSSKNHQNVTKIMSRNQSNIALKILAVACFVYLAIQLVYMNIMVQHKMGPWKQHLKNYPNSQSGLANKKRPEKIQTSVHKPH